LILAGALVVAASAKLASPRSSRAALATFGISSDGLQTAAWSVLIGAELALAAGVAAGIDLAAFLAAALMAAFAVAMALAISRGRAGAPCACFGARSTVSWLAVSRNAALAAAYAALPLLPEGQLGTDEWLGLGLAVALLACLGLGVAVLALAREVGMLRLRLGPDSALEIPEEGPPLGSREVLPAPLGSADGAELALAVFTSRGCAVCHGLAPAIEVLAGEPMLDVASFEEVADAQVWADLAVPGSPYAVAFDTDGTVLAKGAFNNLAQLESVLGTAERRRDAARLAGGLVG
jgi:hypothetical protein